MNYQITDAKTRYFNDKEHYLSFLKAWKKATNSVNAKSTKDKYYGNQVGGWLTSAHMLLFALVRGKDVRSAFKPITKPSKLENGFLINHGMYWAAQELDHVGRLAASDSDYSKRRVEEFLAPFNGTFEKERLIKLVEDMPEIKPIYSNYGKGVDVATALSGSDKQPAELWDIMEEIFNENKAA